MAIDLSVISNLATIARQYEAAASEVPLAVQMALAHAAAQIEGALTETLKTNTPRSDAPGPHLGDTTEGAVEVAGSTATITERQTKTIRIQGTDVPLSQVLTSGHRAFDVGPVTKQALAWPGGEHPVRHAHIPSQAPNPYIAESIAAAQPAIGAALAESGQAMTLAVLNLMR